MKKYLPLMLVLMAGVFMQTKSAIPVEPGKPEREKMTRWLQSCSAAGASAKIAILYLPE